MNDYIEVRARESALYMVLNESTIRSTAEKFGVSKSTTHKDVTERMTKIDPIMAAKTRRILNHNIKVRSVRGGEATRKKHRKD